MDRLTALRVFTAAAEHRSFSEAARRFRMSPAAVSRGIAELEQELGVALLRRTTRSVNPTPEGAAYLERARRILDEIENADRSVRGENAEPRGAFLVTAPVEFGRLHILPVVTAMLERHPALRVQLTLNNRFVRLIEEGIDVAVRIADLSDSALQAIKIAEVRRVLVASPEYIARAGAPGSIAELHSHRLVGFGTLAGSAEWRFGGSGPAAIRFDPVLATDSMEAGITAVERGIGIARVLSYQVVERVRAGRLVYLLEADEPPPWPVHLVFQANRRRAPNVRAFIAAAQDHCQGRLFA